MIRKLVFSWIFRRRKEELPVQGVPEERLAAALRKRETSEPVYRAGWVRHFADQPIVRGKCYVIDGDTIRIGRTRIRLEGIDAPEMDQPYGQTAKWALHRLCKRQIVTVAVTAEDVHGRLVGTCYLPDGRDLGAEMVRMGLALDWRYYSGGRYVGLEPQGARRKLWRQDHLQSRLEVKYESVTVSQSVSLNA